MASKSKRKGSGFEREIVEAAKAAGLEATRAWGSNGQAIGKHESVDVSIQTVLGSIDVQAKRRAKLPDYLQIPEECDVVVIRQDHAEALVLLPLAEWLRLVKSEQESINSR